MTIQTRNVTVTISEPNGDLLVNARVVIRLVGMGNSPEGAVAPGEITKYTDSSGQCVFELWENRQDYSDTYYQVSSYHPQTGMKIHNRLEFMVFDSDADLEDLIIVGLSPSQSLAEQVNADRIAADESRVAAAASASAANAHATTASQAAASAAESFTGAANGAMAASTHANTALSAATAAAASASAAADYVASAPAFYKGEILQADTSGLTTGYFTSFSLEFSKIGNVVTIHGSIVVHTTLPATSSAVLFANYNPLAHAPAVKITPIDSPAYQKAVMTVASGGGIVGNLYLSRPTSTTLTIGVIADKAMTAQTYNFNGSYLADED